MNMEMNFNTQTCTTIEQSKRLLSLGINRDTSDMVWVGRGFVEVRNDFPPPSQTNGLPAWSLHRLLSMYGGNKHIVYTNDAYESLIDEIANTIESGHFSQEYLNKK